VGNVTQRHRHRVGGVHRAQGPGDAEQGLHHAFHLVLVGPAVAGDRLLHAVGRVLDDLASRLHGRDHGHPRRLGHGDRGARIGLEQHPLDGHHRRLVLPKQRAQVGAEGGQALRYAGGGIRAQHPGRHRPGSAPPEPLHDAIAAPRQAGIDAEHEHEFGS
jgi:hypothetical protein